MKQILFIFFLFSITHCISQDYQKAFDNAKADKNVELQEKILNDWASSNTSPEYYLAKITFQYEQSFVEFISLGIPEYSRSNKPKKQRSLDRDKFLEVVKTAKEGIDKFPNRIDIRLSILNKCVEHTKKDNLREFAQSLAVQNKSNKGKWLTTNNEEYQNDILALLESYQAVLRKNSDYDNLIRLSETILDYHPKHLLSYECIWGSFMSLSDYENAIQYLKKAEKIDKNNSKVIYNLAEAYEYSNKPKLAIKYYEKYNKVEPKYTDTINKKIERLKNSVQ
ncbi:hypothetical protein KMW28_05060 [Flammeovirga yaeyamensis]|uniref:Tetratricopeptide repeat protein n=1 Tax=Flammeovirga yaeyamensis TaxID=367791 RepID=A0AAX1N953_9BACT|nr:tetratricopeptide repeat protein [Flammeovirga yaeyamensis]MBB3697528.1 tetratricopeptide (TPR) repeat protein [Flammeovirga yaeyamensis]NMF36222.1 hypothetical protein [Flammeovirga yaeyamensis]QWG02951.1 hypothetical protein KMW28_05060 [Flammeovirga yaeyamensis]